MEFVQQPVAPDLDQDRRRRRRGLIAILLGLSVLTVGSGVFSLAVFTSTDDTTGSFSTGTIILDAEPELTFNATAIFPGDSGDQTVTVTNTGTGELRYAMSSSSTDLDGLGDELDLVITEGACPGSGATLWDASLNGEGLIAFANGNRYEGAVRYNLPHGQGRYTLRDGTEYSGVWNNGCFRLRERWAAVVVSPKECGFE
jgi:hypothetical protein